MFSAESRYAHVPDAVFTGPGGRQIHYRRLRRIPFDIPIQATYVVADGDRFDLVSNTVYGDPLQFWRICDANRGLWPDDLLAVAGRHLDIPEQQ
ncbi:MAG: hypothetical protein JOZ81_17540 [Chloroflexi bacterium]|nr:hypothetical protein [Chloroflexota bacterium]MBV9596857.1 hypothetical protein [Chloroflexota bacterium]